MLNISNKNATCYQIINKWNSYRNWVILFLAKNLSIKYQLVGLCIKWSNQMPYRSLRIFSIRFYINQCRLPRIKSIIKRFTLQHILEIFNKLFLINLIFFTFALNISPRIINHKNAFHVFWLLEH